MKRQHLFLPERQIEEIRNIAKRLGLSMAEVFRRAIDEYIERNSKED
jgi:hypothetical protein